MRAEKMEVKYLSPTSVLILALLVNETTSYSVTDLFVGLSQKATKKYSDSPLHCINECLRRACCTEVGYNVFKGGLKPYTCMLKCDNSTKIDDPGRCESRKILIHTIPTALAGPCQDHRCKRKQLCVGKQKGGYKCIGGSGK